MIESNITCPKADCPKKDECSRHSFYLKALAESESFHILNTTKLQVGPDGCQHFIVPIQEQWACGFKRLCNTIPIGQARNIKWSSIFGSDSTYYRTRRGERLIAPDQQAKILECVRAAGGNPDVGFDRYTTVTVYKGK